MSLAITASIPCFFASSHIFFINIMSWSYIIVFNARNVFTLFSLQSFTIFVRSFIVKLFIDLALMFNCSIPKYTESAPAFIEAFNDSNDPAGDVISTLFSMYLLYLEILLMFVILLFLKFIICF